jgi:hypothetical protein
MAVNRMPAILPMLASDVVHGKGAISVRSTLRPARLSPSSTHGANVGMTTSCFGQPWSSHLHLKGRLRHDYSSSTSRSVLLNANFWPPSVDTGAKAARWSAESCSASETHLGFFGRWGDPFEVVPNFVDASHHKVRVAISVVGVGCGSRPSHNHTSQLPLYFIIRDPKRGRVLGSGFMQKIEYCVELDNVFFTY